MTTKEIKHQICGDGFIQYHPVKTPAQQDMWESILGAVARGWCYEKNANKTMDSELAVAIAKEVHALYTTPPQRTWVGLTDLENAEFVKTMERGNFLVAIYDIEKRLKEKNT